MIPAPFGRRLAAYLIDLTIVSAGLTALCVAFGFVIGIAVSLMTSPIEPDLSNPLGFRYNPMAGSSSLVVLALLLLVFILLLGVVYHGYFIWYEYRRDGRTLGKLWLGLRVVDSGSGGTPTRHQAVVRDMMRYIDCGLVLPGLFAILLDRSSARRLGDRVARTRVIYDPVVRERPSP